MNASRTGVANLKIQVARKLTLHEKVEGLDVAALELASQQSVRANRVRNSGDSGGDVREFHRGYSRRQRPDWNKGIGRKIFIDDHRRVRATQRPADGIRVIRDSITGPDHRFVIQTIRKPQSRRKQDT